MLEGASVFRTDHDAIHILPLSTVPLETKGLKRARLVKNARLEGIVELFSAADTARAKQNLILLAKDLNIDVLEIPSFIQEYGDAYLSLCYYQHCLDHVRPVLNEFYDALDHIIAAPRMNRHQTSAKIDSRMLHIEHRLKAAQSDIASVIYMFKARTGDMWQANTAEKFRRMQVLIREYQVGIGTVLCTICVKMMAWQSTFPNPKIGSASRRTDFVVSHIGPGVDTLGDTKFLDFG